MVDSCRECGKCCRYEIPVTLLDIQRVAKYIGIPEGQVFSEYLQSGISAHSSLLTVAKRNNGDCAFLGKDKQCSVHIVKPRACAFFKCWHESGVYGIKVLPWTATCNDTVTPGEIWEQSVASMFTRVYTKNNGAVFNKDEYYRAMVRIYDNIVASGSQRQKLAEGENGGEKLYLYDCSYCGERVGLASETPVTLDDIRRITEHLGLSWPVFFSEYIDTQKSSPGVLQFKRDGECIFYDSVTDCAIKDVRPMHCNFSHCARQMCKDKAECGLAPGLETLEDRFRYQVAMAMTRRYVEEFGTTCNMSGVRRTLGNIDRILHEHAGIDEFHRNLAVCGCMESGAVPAERAGGVFTR